jgi:PAS domain S-box-containing protein
MLASPLLQEEAHRLQVLLDLNILDTAREERFDRITRMAARLFDVPVALVSLIDADRQWFKSRVGVTIDATDRAHSFCTHTILQDGVMVVEDVLLDERFADNPFILEAGTRFYAGHPLAAPDGSRIGTVCILDRSPRTLDDAQRTLLRDLAGMVSNEIAAEELRRRHRRRHENDSWVHDLLAHIPDGVLMLDSGGTVLGANPAAEHMFGGAGDGDGGAGGLAGRAAASLLGEDAALLFAPTHRADAPPQEGGGRRIDGSAFPIEVQVAPMEMNGQQRYAVIVRDVTRQHDLTLHGRATEERRRKHFTTATHELRTPMASILGFSELLLKRDFDPATSRELLDIIHRQASRLVDLINQLLDLARIEAGGIEGLAIAPVDVAELVRQTLSGLNGLQQGHRIRVELDDGLPALAADAAKLQQALTNIVSNSIKYSSEGSLIDIGASSLRHNGRPMVAIRVADRGIGMTAEQQARIFDAFYRAGESQEVQGSGLGMTIFKEIIELHGGHAEIVSRPGAGTTVTVWLAAGAQHG